MIRLCVLGPSGRMGREVLALAERRDDVTVVAAVDRADSELFGAEVAPGVAVTADLDAALAGADVYIDFTTPAATAAACEAAGRHRAAAVIGTTGMGTEAETAIEALSRSVPVVSAPNFSLGVNVLLGLAEQAARALGPEFDLEVVEIHHRLKRDAPSGTGIALAQALAAGRGRDLNEVKSYSREGDVGPRPDAQIGVVAVRGGDVVGEHTAYLLGANERLEITHRASSRAIFAAGALRAAVWAAGQQPGRYDMRDVLGLG